VKLVCNIGAVEAGGGGEASPGEAIGSIYTKLATMGSWWSECAKSDCHSSSHMNRVTNTTKRTKRTKVPDM
jgi:hypothetical protein